MSLFDGIEDKQGAEGRTPNPTPGEYVFELLELLEGKTTMSQDEFFKARVKVVSSSGEPVAWQDGNKVPPLPAGTESEVAIFKDKFGYYITDIRNLVAAISTSALQEQFEPHQVTQAAITELMTTGEANGCHFRATFSAKPGKFRKKTGEPVCIMRFAGIVKQ